MAAQTGQAFQFDLYFGELLRSGPWNSRIALLLLPVQDRESVKRWREQHSAKGLGMWS